MIYAHISHASPRYRDWVEIVGADRVPIRSIHSHQATAPGRENGARFYHLNLSVLTPEQRARLVALLSRRFGIPEAEITAELDAGAPVPVLAEDVVITWDSRAFL